MLARHESGGLPGGYRDLLKSSRPVGALTPGETMESKDIQIVVLQRGWVVLGEFSQEGDICLIKNGYVLRRWGTTEGLGQLKNGPCAETTYDELPETKFHQLTIVFRLKVGGKWGDLCSAR